MSPDRKALKHWIKTLLRVQMDMQETKASEKDLPIEEFIGRTHRATLGEMRAEQVIDDLLNTHPELEEVYRGLYDGAKAELIEERQRDAEKR